MGGAQRLVGAVHTQCPRLRNGAELYEHPSDLIAIKGEVLEDALPAFVVGITLRPIGKHGSQFVQVNGLVAEQGDHKQGQEGQPGTMPLQMGAQGGLNLANLVQEVVRVGLVVIPSSLSHLSICQIYTDQGLPFLSRHRD